MEASETKTYGDWVKGIVKDRPVSNSQLTAFKRSPQHWVQYITEKKIPTDAMIFGRLVHCLALDSMKLNDEFYHLNTANMPDPDSDFRNAANRDWKKAEIEKAGDLTIVDTSTLDRAYLVTEALYNNEVSRDILQRGQNFENKLEWQLYGTKCIGYEDVNCDDFIADLKVVRNASPRAFQRDMFNTGIYRQGGMYLDGEMKGEFVGDAFKRVFFIAVENTPPFGVSVHELDYEVINFGLGEYRSLVEQLKLCVDAGSFESYNFKNMDGIFDVTLPSYINDFE